MEGCGCCTIVNNIAARRSRHLYFVYIPRFKIKKKISFSGTGFFRVWWYYSKGNTYRIGPGRWSCLNLGPGVSALPNWLMSLGVLPLLCVRYLTDYVPEILTNGAMNEFQRLNDTKRSRPYQNSTNFCCHGRIWEGTTGGESRRHPECDSDVIRHKQFVRSPSLSP